MDLKASLSAKMILLGQNLYRKGWIPATSGNFSAKMNPEEILITAAGTNKATLEIDNFIIIDKNGNAQIAGRPSGETPFHTLIYSHYPDCRAVIHTHAPSSVAISLVQREAKFLEFSHYEILKAFSGVSKHSDKVVLPLLDNHDDLLVIRRRLEALLSSCESKYHGFLIKGHGLFAWGESLEQAVIHTEAFEHLFAVQLNMRRLA